MLFVRENVSLVSVCCCRDCGKIKLPQKQKWVNPTSTEWIAYKKRLKKIFGLDTEFNFLREICPNCNTGKAA